MHTWGPWRKGFPGDLSIPCFPLSRYTASYQIKTKMHKNISFFLLRINGFLNFTSVWQNLTGLHRTITSAPSIIFEMNTSWWNTSWEPGLIARPQYALVAERDQIPVARFRNLSIYRLSKYIFIMEEGEESNTLSAETEIETLQPYQPLKRIWSEVWTFRLGWEQVLESLENILQPKLVTQQSWWYMPMTTTCHYIWFPRAENVHYQLIIMKITLHNGISLSKIIVLWNFHIDTFLFLCNWQYESFVYVSAYAHTHKPLYPHTYLPCYNTNQSAVRGGEGLWQLYGRWSRTR